MSKEELDAFEEEVLGEDVKVPEIKVNEIKMLNIEDIKEDGNNPNVMSQSKLDALKKNLKKFGNLVPIVVNKDYLLADGAQRLQVYREMGVKQIPAIVLDVSEVDRRILRQVLNKLRGEHDFDLDLKEFKFISDELGDLKELNDFVAFDDKEYGEIMDSLSRNDYSDKDLDEVSEVSDVVTDIERGDVFELGEHRIMCGDATCKEDVDKLVNGVKVDMVFTDPPYGINEQGDRSNRRGLCKGNKLNNFIDDSNKYAIDAYNILKEYKIPIQVWWGANYYCHSLPESNNWLVWDKRIEDKQTDTQSDCELAYIIDKHNSVRIFRHLWKGMMKGSENGQRRVHPTQKPIKLAEWCFDKYASNSKFIIDLFLGSGSTLIACQCVNRICYGMELEPKYCEVSIRRWEDLTGKKRKKVLG